MEIAALIDLKKGKSYISRYLIIIGWKIKLGKVCLKKKGNFKTPRLFVCFNGRFIYF